MEQTTKKRKFNVIDLIFLVIIIAAVVVIGVRFFDDAKEKTSEQTYIVVIHSDETPDYTKNGYDIGSTVIDETENLFGTVVDYQINESKVFNPDAEGNDVASPREGSVSVDITLEVQANGNEHYIIKNGKKYSINTGFTAVCGKSKMWVYISALEPKS